MQVTVFRRFLKDEEGFGTVEIVLIIAVLIGIALIFRDAIIKFAVGIMKSVFGDQNIIDDINSSGIRDNNRINQGLPYGLPFRHIH